MEFFSTFLGKVVTIFFISMVPVIELRGAIPAGVASGLNLYLAALISIFGNMLPVPFIIIFIRKIFEWLRTKSDALDKLVARLEERADRHRDRVSRYKFWGLFVLVAIPLPGTGAWTGALVGALLDIRLKHLIPTVLAGVVTAGIIMCIITYGASALISLV